MKTPRTDAAKFRVGDSDHFAVHVTHAEQLETELSQAEKKIQHHEKLNSDRCNMERAMRHMQDELASCCAQLDAVRSLAANLADALSSCTEQEWFKLGKSGKVTVTLDANRVRHVLATYGKKGN